MYYYEINQYALLDELFIYKWVEEIRETPGLVKFALKSLIHFYNDWCQFKYVVLSIILHVPAMFEN